MNKAAEEVSGLRVALAHRRGDPPAQRVGGAGIVLGAVAQVRVQVARRGEADAVDFRVLGGVHKLVQVGGIEPALQAELARIGFAGKRNLAAIGERPVGAAQRDDLAVFRSPAGQRGFGGIEAGRIGGPGNAAAKNRQGRRVRGHVAEAGEHAPGDAGAIRILGYRRRQRLHAIGLARCLLASRWRPARAPAFGHRRGIHHRSN